MRDELVQTLLKDRIDGLLIANQGRATSDEVINPSTEELTKDQALLQTTTASVTQRKNLRQQQYRAAGINTPRYEPFAFNDKWRAGEDSVTVSSENFIKADKNGLYKNFYVNDISARSLLVHLRHRLFLKDEDTDADAKNPSAEVKVRCNQAFTLVKPIANQPFKAGETATLKLHDYKTKDEINLEFKDGFTGCDVRFKLDGKSEVFGFQVMPESKLLANLEFTQNNAGNCILPDATATGLQEALFLNDLSGKFSCPQKVDKWRHLIDPEDALNEKVKALLGYGLTKAQVQGNDPNIKFDLTKMPKLDAVFISSLLFRADFYGTLIRRLLEIHASRGAQIRVIVSDNVIEKTDSWRLWDASMSHPNFKYVSFKYNAQGTTGTEILSKYHRTMHTKMFLTFSKSNPDANIAIFGGRNISDCYAFREPKDMSKVPFVSNYNPDSYLYFSDYEVEFQNPALTRDLMAQWFTFYNIDYGSMNVRNTNVNFRGGAVTPNYFRLDPKQVLVRNFMSFPFRGDMALEDFYVLAFDTARASIKIMTPYFSPTKRIGEAMERASARGVKVEVITGFNFNGDTFDEMLGTVNIAAANRFLGKIQMYDYSEPDTVLHSKIVTIDDRISLVGSPNLNQRSFYHDSESSVMVYSAEYNKQLGDYFSSYKKKSQLMTEKKKATYWKKVLVRMFQQDF
jgi:phosphatidylserine/phosphatidylglycerophosphate/cardiolipin synthase-like enzyme